MKVATTAGEEEGEGEEESEGGRRRREKNNEMNIERESRNYYTSTAGAGLVGVDSVSLYKLGGGSV